MEHRVRRASLYGWTREEVTELKRLRLDPIRNTPAKFRSLVAHFLKPGASVFAVTEGEGPVKVSKALARKVRDLTLGRALDWVVEDGLRKEVIAADHIS